MIKGFGGGKIGLVLKEEPNENSRARSISGFETLSGGGIVSLGFWVSLILEQEAKNLSGAEGKR
jgi:hypothetical protein